MSHSRTLKIAAMAALALASATPAFAGDAAPSKGVYYGDLNLTRDGDVAQLHQRIKAAASDVCITEERLPGTERALDRCRWRAERDAKVHVGTVVAMARSGNVYAAADIR